MNPQAAEFVPSWLPKPAAEEAAASPEAPSQKAAEAQPVSAEEPPEAWEDDDPREGTPAGQASSKVDVSAAKNPAQPSADAVEAATAGVSDLKVNGGKAQSTPSAARKTGAAASSTGGPSSASQSAKQADPSAGTDMKKPMNVVLLGHVDAGKSTISGHILYLTGNVDERTMEKYEKEAKALNRESWKYAWALDTSDQERAKGKTEEYGQAAFTTESRRFTILDAPGHKNYVPHMIGGATQADIGILVISARKGEFETGFERGGQTREHAMLAKTSGVRQLVVVINKLDDPSVLNPDGSWSKDRFDECKTGLEPFLRSVGWNLKEVVWIPVSGLSGGNLKERTAEKVCPWYRGASLLETLETLKAPERLLSGSVKMPISEKHKEMGTMVKGRLESGVIRLNDKLVMMPNRVDVVVDAVELEGTECTAAEPGDNVRLRLKGIDDEDIRVGFVLCSPHDLVSYTNRFDAQIMVVEHKSIICAGYAAVMHIHQVEVEFRIEKLLAELDKKTGKISKKNPMFVKPGMKCIARVATTQPICTEPFKIFPQLGRFMLRDEGKTIGAGVVLKIRESGAAPTAEE